MMTRLMLTAVLLAFAAPLAWAKPAGIDVPLEHFFRDAQFTDVTLSPDGEHLAVTVPQEDRTLLAVLKVSNNELVGKWDYGRNNHIGSVIWSTNDRVVFRVARKLGSFDFRVGRADMYASNIDGTRRIDIPNGNTYQIIGRVNAQPGWLWVQRSIESAYLFRLDTQTGRVLTHAEAPLRAGSFLLDHSGELRYAVGVVEGRRVRTLRRVGDGWVTVHETTDGGGTLRPIMFAPDNKRVYAIVSDEGEPAKLVLRDPETGAQTVVSHNGTVEPLGFIRTSDETDLLAVRYFDGLPSYDIVNPEHPEARVMAGLQQAFPDHAVAFANASDDGRYFLFRAYSDVDPGRYFLFDREQGSAKFLLANREWIDSEKMSQTRAVSFQSRDGLTIHGYLTLPKGLEPQGLPMVVWVHGGPHGIRDVWGFDNHVQVMASRGYAVLQINFRGSGGYGEKFNVMGYRNWGTTMQDDLTDGVKWAIDEGYAGADRVCIFGASYGGYAALMSPMREPDLYRCTIGYVGVYTLPGMFRWGDIPQSSFGREFQARILPETAEEQRAQSPVYNVDKLKAPVMLVHGREDQRVPMQQYDALMDALRAAGKPPEDTVVERKEGHGFYDTKNNVNLFTRVFRFLDKHTAPR